MSVVVLALSQAAEEGPKKSFLQPDGTFFVVLAIFVIVLAVISTFVVPPIMKVLRERENMVTKTLADNRESAEQFASAEADYDKQMAAARLQASAARDDARAAGRKVIDEHRSAAEAEVASTLQAASDQLKKEGDAVSGQLQNRVETLSAALASRILGVDIEALSAAKTGR